MSHSERKSLLGRDEDDDDDYDGHDPVTAAEMRAIDDDMGESPLRAATEEDPSMKKGSRRARILARRGAFQCLPVACSNDLVHGSWWFVWGSLVATLIPIVPVVELFYPFWPQSESSLPLLQDAATFVLLIFSGVFFTLGSLAFVRAFEDPPLKPLFSNEHLATDELLGAWLFLIATIPFVPFVSLYVYYNVHVLVYWGSLVASIIFVLATYIFVQSCYPMERSREQSIPALAALIFGPKCWILKHVCNDWLASCWLFFYGTVLMCGGSATMLYFAIQEGNHMEIFDWSTSLLDSILFLIGCAYFVAGSYPQDHCASGHSHGHAYIHVKEGSTTASASNTTSGTIATSSTTAGSAAGQGTNPITTKDLIV